MHPNPPLHPTWPLTERWSTGRLALVRSGPVVLAVGALAVLVSITVLVVHHLAGHSGAVAVWAAR